MFRVRGRVLTDVTVITTASRPETRDWVKPLGAHHVVDHSRPLITPSVMKSSMSFREKGHSGLMTRLKKHRLSPGTCWSFRGVRCMRCRVSCVILSFFLPSTHRVGHRMTWCLSILPKARLPVSSRVSEVMPRVTDEWELCPCSACPQNAA